MPCLSLKLFAIMKQKYWNLLSQEDGFLKLQSHYLFREHFCRVARPNEKGVVEGVVKFARLNFLVPVPQVRDLDELNAMLRKKCREDMKRRLRGKTGTKAELFEEERKAFLEPPIAVFDACRKQPTRDCDRTATN